MHAAIAVEGASARARRGRCRSRWCTRDRRSRRSPRLGSPAARTAGSRGRTRRALAQQPGVVTDVEHGGTDAGVGDALPRGGHARLARRADEVRVVDDPVAVVVLAVADLVAARVDRLVVVVAVDVLERAGRLIDLAAEGVAVAVVVAVRAVVDDPVAVVVVAVADVFRLTGLAAGPFAVHPRRTGAVAGVDVRRHRARRRGHVARARSPRSPDPAPATSGDTRSERAMAKPRVPSFIRTEPREGARHLRGRGVPDTTTGGVVGARASLRGRRRIARPGEEKYRGSREPRRPDDVAHVRDHRLLVRARLAVLDLRVAVGVGGGGVRLGAIAERLQPEDRSHDDASHADHRRAGRDPVEPSVVLLGRRGRRRLRGRRRGLHGLRRLLDLLARPLEALQVRVGLRALGVARSICS